MTSVHSRAAKLGLVACLVLVPAIVGAAVPLAPVITVVAGTGLVGLTHTIPIGGGIIMEVDLSFQDLGGLLDTRMADSAGGTDLYVGAILPDGRFMSWVGDPQASTFVTGPSPVPLLVGFIPKEGAQFFSRHLNFAVGDPQGWYVLYGLIVRAGANPLDPREWGGWNPTSFYPFLVTPPVTTLP